MEEPKERTYCGTAVVGLGSESPREVKIINVVQATYKDHRLVTVSEGDNEEGYFIAVENPSTSGRANLNSMWLTKESFIACLSSMIAFCNMRGISIEGEFKKICVNNEITYNHNGDDMKEFDTNQSPVAPHQ